MNTIILKAKKLPYLVFALIAIILALAALLEQLQGFLKPNIPKFLWQVVTGVGPGQSHEYTYRLKASLWAFNHGFFTMR